MKEFLKMFLASILAGFFIIFGSFFFFILIFSITSSKDPSIKIEKNSYLSIDLTRGFSDNPQEISFANLLLSAEVTKPYRVFDVIRALEQAASDEQIAGVYLDFGYGALAAGNAQLQEIREALKTFKETGKPIIAYGRAYSQKGYFIASVADSIFMNPNGIVEWAGLSSNYTFYKTALEKAGVKPVVLRPRNNKFKSAVEPYLENEISAPNAAQIRRIQEVNWNYFKSAVSRSRSISEALLDSAATNFLTLESAQCLALGFIDQHFYDDEMRSKMQAFTKAKDDKDPVLVDINRYFQAKKGDIFGTERDQIAILYAEGEIIDGSGSESSIAGDAFIETLRKIRTSKRVKGLVIRINSPGGSAYASDLLWREIALIKEIMPVVVSMGNVAASGGYYMACPADTILVNPLTITGSIGVFGVFFTAQELLEDKLGLRYDGIKTHPFADLGSLNRDISPMEMALLEGNVTRTYGKFLSRVADGRSLDSIFVDSVGQGRVWMGQDAIQLGLADLEGNLNDAIQIVDEMAGLNGKFKISEFPKPLDPIQRILKQLNLDDMTDAKLRKELGPLYKEYIKMKQLLDNQGVLMRMEMEVAL
jgi:protease IV